MWLSSLLLSYYLAGIELNQHSTICLKLLDRDGESEVVKDEKLQFEMVKLDQRKASDLEILLMIWRSIGMRLKLTLAYLEFV